MRIVDSLFSFIADKLNMFGKELNMSNPNWTSGTCTITNSSKYKVFLITQGGQTIIAFMRDTNLYVDGLGVQGGTNGYNYVKTFSASVNGDTWTYRWANELTHTASGNHSASSNGQAITKVIGLVPNLG